MIQDIMPHRLNNHYTEKTPDGESICFYAVEGRLLMQVSDGKISYPGPIPGTQKDLIFAFELDGRDCFLYLGRKKPEELTGSLSGEGWTFENASALRALNPRYFAFAGVTALHLAAWYQSSRFCGRCGTAL